MWYLARCPTRARLLSDAPPVLICASSPRVEMRREVHWRSHVPGPADCSERDICHRPDVSETVIALRAVVAGRRPYAACARSSASHAPHAVSTPSQLPRGSGAGQRGTGASEPLFGTKAISIAGSMNESRASRPSVPISFHGFPSQISWRPLEDDSSPA